MVRTNLPIYTPARFIVSEVLKNAWDSRGETYKELEIEYVTAGSRDGRDSFEIFIPNHPENNIDNYWEGGISFIRGNVKDGKLLIGNGEDGSRWLVIKAVEPL